MSQSRAERKFERRLDNAARNFEIGDLDAAQEILETLLLKSSYNDRPQLLHYLASVERKRGDDAKAVEFLTQASELQPDDPETWNRIGILNIETLNFGKAVEAFERLARLLPQNPEVLVSLANAQQGNDQNAEAIDVYRRALSLLPNHSSAWTGLSRALLKEGQWDDALTAADRQLFLQPGHTGSLALKSIALQELHHEEAWNNLVDFDRLIGSSDIQPDSEAYPTLGDFNHELAEHCRCHTSLKYAPAHNTTNLGYQTADLANDGEKVIVDLLAAIEHSIQRYLHDRPIDHDHPFLGQRPSAWDYCIWGTVLETNGHQTSHIHRDGWLSGVYYAQLPTSIDSDPEPTNPDGWIEFGRPQNYPRACAKPKTQTHQPVEGRLYVFPSYFYHRTIPFESQTARISIAFDLLPKNRER